MVIISGYDAPMEEVYFFVAHHALSRGYTCIIFDGPGQGGTLLESGLTLSHVYDKVLDGVLQEAARHGAWTHTVVQGLSLGGLLCLQAVSPAAIQSKVHAVIADPGEKNLLDMFRQRLPFPRDLRDQMPHGTGDAVAILDFMLTRMSLANDATGWALRRGMLVHGVTTPLDYARTLPDFDNEPILGKVGIPTLITKAEKDDIAAQATEVFERLTRSARKALIEFSDEEGAGDHCSNGARSFFSEQVCLWLDQVLQDQPNAET